MNKKEIEVIKSYIDGVLKGKEQGLAELNNVIFSLINIESTLSKCEKDNEELKKLREENKMLLNKMPKKESEELLSNEDFMRMKGVQVT